MPLLLTSRTFGLREDELESVFKKCETCCCWFYDLYT